ncbi:MAG: hypothetical protein SFY80_17180 [Verrucomicrobiota bacterium]|nr:hypothetical protein [Verrucomicrobiota bacterium]
MMSNTPTSPEQNAITFNAGSAEEAARFLRQRYDNKARVTAVQSVRKRGWRGLFGATHLQVTAKVDAPVDTRRQAPAQPIASSAPEAESISPQAASTSYGHAAEFLSGNRSATTTATAATSISHQPSRRINLESLMDRAGFSTSLHYRLREHPSWSHWQELPLHQALKEIGDHLKSLIPPRPKALPSRVAFLGVPGGGRTTALCKWLTSEVFQHERKCQVVTVDFDQPECHERLSMHCQLLGITCLRHPSPPDTDAAHVYYDMPALGMGKSTEVLTQAHFLDEAKISARVLVLPAVYEPAVLRSYCAMAAPLRCTHLVFTHLDALTGWAKLWDFALDAKLPILFVGTGSDLASGWEPDIAPLLLQKTFRWSLENEVNL